MASPPIEILVQPTDGSRLFYLPIAAKAQGEPEFVKIVLRLRLHNPSDKQVRLSAIRFAYPGSTHAQSRMKGVRIAVDPEGEADRDDGVIAAGTTATWSNGVVDLDTSEDGENHVRNEVYLPTPAPPRIEIQVSCQGFSDPAKLSVDLVPYVRPTGTGALRLPMARGDLDRGEYLVTSARHWANGGANGTQIYAHDIGVQARVNGVWTQLHDGVTSSANADYRIWGKPLRALADGVVVSCADQHPDNAFPGAERPEGVPGAGNSMRIRHGDIEVIYAHLQWGSIPTALKQPNAAVRSGDLIGLAGNSGRSSNPHLHLEGRDSATNTLRGLPFRVGAVLERDRINADQSGPWVTLTADGICQDKVAIRPGWDFGRIGPDFTMIELEEIVGQVFGGVSQGGDGFVIVDGKLHKVPPRSPRWSLLEAVSELIEHAGDPRRTAVIGSSIERLGREIATGR
jgi:murein DD-endopeptidase MepM/ murein hydrolase activator NlpD